MNGNGAMFSLQLVVADLGSTEAFYGGILELPVERSLTVPGAPEHLVLRLNGVELLFVEEASVLAAHPLLEQRLAAYPRGAGFTLHVRVTGIEEISAAIFEEELEILYPLDKKPYGMKDLWCFDPDGYLVVLEELWR